MKFACETALISRACADLSRIAPKNSVTPILRNILIETHEHEIVFSVTDLEATLCAKIPANVTEPGSTTVDTEILTKYFAAATSDRTEFETEGDAQLRIKSGRSTFRANTLPANEYPKIPTCDEASTFTVDARLFAERLASTTFAASSNDLRGAALGGLRIKVDQSGSVDVAATDGYVLAQHPIAIAGGTPVSGTFIVPAYACNEISRMLTKLEKGAQVSLSFDVRADGNASMLAVTAPERTLLVRLVNLQYPNIAQVIPATFERVAVVPTADFMAALKRSSLAESKSQTPRVTLTLGASNINISSESDLIGSADEDVDAVVTGDEMTICFNASYLNDVVSRVPTREMRMEFLGPLSPTVIRSVGDNAAPDDLFLVMPMRG